MRILRALDKGVERLSEAVFLGGGILLLAMAITVFYSVVVSYAFHNPSAVAIELSKVLMVPGMIVTAAYIQRHNEHLRVTFLSSRFPQKVQTVLFEILTPILAVVVVSVMVWKAWDAAYYSYVMGETGYSAWGQPLWPVKMTIPIGYGVLLVTLVAQLVRGVVRLVMSEIGEPEDPATLPTKDGA